MKTKIIFVLFIAAFLAACNNGTKKETDAIVSLDQPPSIPAGDSITEAEMLNPKLDQNKIYGLGIFKIGASVENSINLLAADKKYKYDTLWSFDQYVRVRSKEWLILKVDRAPTTLQRLEEADVDRHAKASWCKHVSMYVVSKYEIDSLEIDHIILRYYDDRLYDISCWNTPELLNAIAAKYGKPDNEERNAKGNFISLTYKNGDVKALYLGNEYFNISIRGSEWLVGDCATKDFNAQDAIDKAAKAKGLKNL